MTFFTAHILQQVCDVIMQTIHDTCAEVGVPMSLSKRVFATQVIEFLGLLIDTFLMIVQVPQDKQCDILTNRLPTYWGPSTPLWKHGQSLAGKLNFITKAFPNGSPLHSQFV